MALVVIGTHDGVTLPAPAGRHDSKTLQSGAQRVSTDMHMVETLCHKAVSGDGLSPEVRAAVREAFLLHVWSLREFFYGRRRPDVGVVASDYFRAPAEWEAVRPPLPVSLDADWHRFGGSVKPVSRVEPGAGTEGPRPYHRFTKELAALTRSFLDALPPDRAAWFEIRA